MSSVSMIGGVFADTREVRAWDHHAMICSREPQSIYGCFRGPETGFRLRSKSLRRVCLSEHSNMSSIGNHTKGWNIRRFEILGNGGK